ncbi:GNAT family N-acetyltransferase [Geotoga petraea]|jgi:N-acetylglutamate synthase-like GNAT family acetyltransferase|uniref:N-acetylglutamate synthase, GNAT family n=1 Tax=Geotoga petraea TaxID=28234 RepID=A0A1G6K559_9BACT|nr:GNAT family N-acetyltransferase [Geotoga petraea]TGG88425.1 N-acetyltransferase [Geotoga petraea]SDC26063.1 N-acetylglutamate synthase, GNAT family [Geotoga petraea]
MILRKALIDDRDDINKISEVTWEGHDYLKNIFDKWINEKDSDFSVLEKDGKVIGTIKLTYLQNREYWLEGLRIHPDYQGRGYAKYLTKEYLKKIKNLDFDLVSMATFYTSKSVDIVKKYGFYLLNSLKIYRINEKKEINDIKNYEVVENYNDVMFILDSEQLKVRKGYFTFDWTAINASAELIKKLVDRKEVYVKKIEGKIVSLIILSKMYNKEGIMSISFIWGENHFDEALDFAISKYNDVYRPGSEFLYMCEDDEQLRNILVKKGFEEASKEKNDFVIYGVRSPEEIKNI